MESKNRNVWIIVAVIVVALCCCALAAVAATVGWFTTQPFDWSGSTSVERERSEQTFAVGAAPSLEIDSFAGNMIVRAGESGVIRVVATKRAPRKGDLNQIQVQVSERDGGLLIKTEKPFSLNNASVELEIITPAGTRLGAHTGAGDVSVCCLVGGVKIDTGAGDINADNVTGEINARSGAGRIEYQGTPQGDSSFQVGAGNIKLVLPANLSVEVDLDTGGGDIDVDFSVRGQVARREVNGVIGSGEQGKITAHTGAGNIDLQQR